MQPPTYHPVGKYVLVQLDKDKGLKEAIVVGIGGAVPKEYLSTKRRKGIKIGARVALDKEYIVDEFDVADGDDDVFFALTHIDGIYGVLNKK